MANIENYYQTFDEKKQFERIMYRDGYVLQGRELNDAQEISATRLKNIADAVFSDGDLVRDAQISVNEKTGEVQAQSGAVYLNGAVRTVSAASFVIPNTGTIAVGVRLKSTFVSENEDPSLRNPAQGCDGEGEPGAWRLKVEAYWSYDGDGATGDFFPIHIVENGVVRPKEAPPALDSMNQAISRYDRDSTGGGTYISTGLHVAASTDREDGKQVYSVSEGRCRVNGYGVELVTSRRIAYEAKPDLRLVDTEVVEATGDLKQRINVAHAPIHAITALHVPLSHTETVVHGNYSGCADPLSKTGVLRVTQVRMGETIYEEGNDYKRTGDTIDWSPLGNEPSPGDTYEVTHVYLDRSHQPEEQDFDGFSVSGAVAGHSIMFSYEQALPRIDRLCLDAEGVFTWIQGVPAEYNAKIPPVPVGLLSLAIVHQTWRDLANRRIDSNGTRVVAFEDFKALADRVDYVLQEVARNRLETDAATREAGARVGMFVDPLLDDSMRDQGLEQTAAVVNGMLTLPISAEAFSLSNDIATPRARSFTPYILLEQPLRTGSMLINPYQAFDPMPAKTVISPAVDRWTENKTIWASSITKIFGSGNASSSSSATETISSEKSEIQYLRQIEVKFSVEGFGPGENLANVTFDGIAVETTGETVANGEGIIKGAFTIPKNIPAGSKEVIVSGQGGSRGVGVFVGQGTLVATTLRQVTTLWRWSTDPLAQTFTCEKDTLLAGVDLFFTAKGESGVRVQIRETNNGVPTRTVLAEASLKPSEIVVTGQGHTRVLFDAPCPVNGGTEYSLVILTDDAVTALAVAELGKYDQIHQQWVSNQAYTIGVLLSSSNASTWTPHQDKDLTFRLLGAKFTAADATIDLGQTVNVRGATDILLFAAAETTNAKARVEYELTMPDGNSMTVASEQAVRLTRPISGELGIKARLIGDSQTSPVLWPGTQLIAGTTGNQGTYYTRSIKATGATKAVLIYNGFLPGGTSCAVEIQKDSEGWISMPQRSTVQQGDGVVEYSHSVDLSGNDLLKVKITLTGDSSARPYISDIRFMAVA